MSELTIYGYIISQPVRSILAYLKLSNIQYTFQHMDLTKGAHLSDEFTQINPYQTIPAMVHEGFNLWESAAMLPYISSVFNVDNQWYPKDPKQRARIDAYLHWHHQNVREPCMNYLRAKVIGPMVYGAPQLTEEQEGPLRERFIQVLTDVKWNLKSTGFLARSSEATIADIFAYNEIAAMIRLFEIDEYPDIKDWCEKISGIPEVKELQDQALEMFTRMLA